jgi:hypothetical protein
MQKVLLVGLFLLLPNATLCGTECRALVVKPIHHVCGFVIDPSGQAVSDAKVTVLNGDLEIASVQTSKDGTFELDDLKAGTYYISVRKTGFVTAYSPITLTAPSKKCKNELGVALNVGMGCSLVTEGKKLKKSKAA